MLCNTYQGLSPFEVEHNKYIDVIMLYDYVLGTIDDKDLEPVKRKNSKEIRRPAGDSWY